MIEMKIINVQEVLPTNVPVVLLQEEAGDRILPIFIGRPEATAIGLSLANQTPPRPMTHDLLAKIVDSFGFQVERIEITELPEKTFFADIYFRGSTGVEVVSARPSDALAIAVRTGAAIYADDEVLNQASYIADEDDELSEDQFEVFREFLDSVNPDDFAE